MDQSSAIEALAALAQPTRLATFRLLVRHEPDGLPAGELARLVDVPQNTLSAHLATLARAGLVEGQRHSRSIVYRVRLDRLNALMLFLLEDCCAGSSAVCTPLIDALAPRCMPRTGV